MQPDDPDMAWFTDAADARAYLDEIGRLWSVWLLALVGLLLFDGVLLLLTVVGLVAGWLLLARPLQRRTTRLVEAEPAAGEGWEASTERGKERDRVLRELTVGRAPLEAALRDVGASPGWIYVRYGMIALTVLALIYIFFGFVSGS